MERVLNTVYRCWGELDNWHISKGYQFRIAYKDNLICRVEYIVSTLHTLSAYTKVTTRTFTYSVSRNLVCVVEKKKKERKNALSFIHMHCYRTPLTTNMASVDVSEIDDLLRPPQSVHTMLLHMCPLACDFNYWRVDAIRPEPELLQRLDAKHTITTTFSLKERTYQQQFSDTYFLRLTKLKPAVEEAAKRLWTVCLVNDLEIEG